jgi:hypothetical protein
LKYGETCEPLCGDRVVVNPKEECDLGDQNGGSDTGCDRYCKVSNGIIIHHFLWIKLFRLNHVYNIYFKNYYLFSPLFGSN